MPSTRAMLEGLCWILLAGGSGAASWAAWVSPMWAEAPSPPPALPRPATPEERASVEARRALLLSAAQRIQAQVGRAPSASELMGALAGELPDNPLIPGPPSLLEACPPSGEQADWLWCPQTGALEPGQPADQKGKG